MLRTDDWARCDTRGTVAGEYAVVVLAGQLDGESVPEVEKELTAAIELELPLVIVDLDAVQFINTAGLHAIVVAARHALRQGGRLTLVCGVESVLQILDMTGVGDHLGVHASVGAALSNSRHRA